MSKINWKDVGIRSFKTFLEAFLTYAATAIAGIQYGNGSIEDTVWIGALFCGVCTGITAVINGVIIPLFRTDPAENG